MRSKTSTLKLSLSLVVFLAVGFLCLRYQLTSAPVARANIQSSPPSSLYLPVIFRDFFSQTVFGVEMSEITVDDGLNQVSAANTTWVRRNAVIWSDIEPTPGARNWSTLASMETEWLNAANNGITPIVVVRSTPTWAMALAGSSCGPITTDALGAFASFMRDLVARYSVSPYNIKYWEIWNEPDIDPSLVSGDSGYGCWGNQSDPYYGGGYYAQMLKAVYPQIKAADPGSQVLVGGLLLSCNPNVPGACGGNSRPPQFLTGILSSGGGAYFDGVSFHAYDFYGSALGRYSNSPNWNSNWNTTGPVIIAKTNYIDSLLATYGVTGKFLMSTESALLCDICNSDPTFETTKAYYVAQVYASAMAQRLGANIWFSLFGWRNSGLLNPDLSPLPAYSAYKFARSQLGNSGFVSEITGYSGVKAYAFGGGHLIWLMWSLDGNAHSITLPNTPSAAWDVLGNPLPLSASVTIDLMPVYFKW
jgi:hypothetical protein